MNRREFSRMVVGGSVGAMLPSTFLLSQATAQPAISPQAAELYKRALILDCNLGPPGTGTLPMSPTDLGLVRNSGVNVIKWSLGGINEGFADTAAEIAYAQQMIEVHPEYFLQVRMPADMERTRRENKLGMILSFESTDMLEGKLDNLELFRDFGVRVMQLSYNRKSPFGAGVMEPNGGGLTPLGKDCGKENECARHHRGLEPCQPANHSDAMAASVKPVIMSHAGCVAVHPHPRNKTDDQLRALADKGGVVGIYDLPYLAASPKQPDVDDYMAHMEHALKVVGEDHVGVGSDAGISPFDTSPEGMAEFKKSVDQRQKSRPGRARGRPATVRHRTEHSAQNRSHRRSAA